MTEGQGHRDDLIGLFARHPVAPNLMMLIMLLTGLVALNSLNTQFLPNFELDFVTVRVIWRGASAEDVEDSLTNRIEQELKSVDFVKKMTSTSSYGSALVALEFEENTDMGKALDQVKDYVAQIRNLPADSEEPEIILVTRYDEVARLLITTRGQLIELRDLVYQIERELLDAGISRVDINGLPEQEIAIQLSTHQLESLGLSLQQVSDRIASQSRDLPAGEIGNNEVARQLRSLDQRRDSKSFGNLSLKTDYHGRQLILDDVASIEQRPVSNQVQIFYQGQPAVEMMLQRTKNADSLKAAQILETWLQDNQGQLPKGVQIEVYDAKWKLIKERMDLLLNNGLNGLVLILVILFLFLHGRVAFWVAVGIPVSFMAALSVLYLLGGSINMVSLFGLIMALGIIVDDAIVVGENALAHYQRGESSLMAAEGGARRMLAPVISSSLTTVASFLPLMMISGTTGNILFDIPFVVVCVIIASLIESFFILPGHLHHSFHAMHHARSGAKRQWLDDNFTAFKENFFRPLVTLAIQHRWVTVAITVALLMISAGLVKSGRLAFNFFPSPEETMIIANTRFVAGTPQQRVARFMQHLNETVEQTAGEFDEKVLRLAVIRLGAAAAVNPNAEAQQNERFGSIRLELVSPDQREIDNKRFIREWKKHIVLPPGIETFTISGLRGGPPGNDIDIVLTGTGTDELKQAAQEVAAELKEYVGVSAIEDDLPYGQEQLIYRLKAHGEALGLTVKNIGQQLRAAFDGQLVQIFQKGDDEIEVRAVLPDKERHTLATLENMMIRLPNGGSAPLSSVVEFEAQRGFDVLRHTDARLAVHITARVDAALNNNNKILSSMQKQFLPELSRRYGVKVSYEGRAEEQTEALADMFEGSLLAFVLIYLVLAWVFASYGWPFVVMLAIPCGVIGAFFGHLLMQIDLTILSLFGLFGLSGIVVNDSIILVTFFKHLRETGMPTEKAIIEAATQRLRAVLLTSLTTIAGLTPLLFETSLQAQFLIPMATSISFGLMASTLLVLVVIPAVLSIYESALVRVKHALARVKQRFQAVRKHEQAG